MNEIFAAVEGRPKRRQGITGQTIEAQMRGTMCQITEYELDVLREEIARLTAELEEVKAERDTARAETAMAFEVAATHYENGFPAWDVFGYFIRECRALTPAHAKAALAARDKATREQALREAADLVESFALGGDRYEYGHDDASMRVAIRGVILEAI